MFWRWLPWIRLQPHVFRVLDTLKASTVLRGTLAKVSSYSKLVLAKAPPGNLGEIESTSLQLLIILCICE